ncbi:MAG TPA: enoyl-CoA hydratase/isomerase family protein [Kofleriaceae bacterium]|nr:enoyl-CoA hydratase/isomerase family protein [Kofleriaceae bacterium]
MSDAVHYRREDAVGIITLDRPDNRNSMTPELLDAFSAASAAARTDGGARCVIITGTGTCFSAGADFKSTIQRDGTWPRQAHERSYAMYEPFLSVLDIEVPVIAALNGHTVGGGLGLALVCDIRVGNRDAKYGANFCKLGLHPGMSISYLLPHLIGASRAAELMFTGRLMLGEEAERVGLLSAAVGAEEVMPRAMETARAIAANAPIAVRMTKRTMYENLGWRVRDAAWREAFAQAVTVDTEDVAEGIAALLEKRPPVFHGR